jgi:hypothetical protein
VISRNKEVKDLVIRHFFNMAVKGNCQEVLASLKDVPFQMSIGEVLVNGNIYLFVQEMS